MAASSSASGQSQIRQSSRLMTVNQALDLLFDDYAQADNANIFMEPPDVTEDTDGDSDEEEDGDGDVNRLSGRQLSSGCSVTLRSGGERMTVGNNEDIEQSIPSSSSSSGKSTASRKWSRRDMPRLRNEGIIWDRAWIEDKDYSPRNLFELFFDEDVISYICQSSELYAAQHGKDSFKLTATDLKLTFAILLISGYAPVPRRRLYWENSEDTHNDAVASAMKVNRFEEIISFLHFADNTRLNPGDKFSKLRPIMCMLNERFLQAWPETEAVNVDESMIPYFGHHSAKQFIRGKPLRFGFKVWCLNSPTGYLVQFEAYQGAGTVRIQPGLGMGGSVVMDLISELPQKPYDVYFDNLFTSLPLLETLTERGVHGTGTVRTNRTQKCPLTSPDLMKKTEQGSVDFRRDMSSKLILVRWVDNSVVTCASTTHGVYPLQPARRWSSSKHQEIQLGMPYILKKYNKNMGGTDRMDQNIAKYRPGIRKKKWWWSVFIFLLSTSVNNAWQLFRRSAAPRAQETDLLEFTRQIAMTYILQYRQRAGTFALGRISNACRVPEDVRYDNRGHYLSSNPTQRRCAQCGKKTKKRCVKCPQCPLHEVCFAAYHTQK